MFWQHERSDEGRFALQARTHLPNRRLNAAPVSDEREDLQGNMGSRARRRLLRTREAERHSGRGCAYDACPPAGLLKA